MRFAFSKRIARERGWTVFKPTFIVKLGCAEILAGVLTDSPPSGRRAWLYTQPLFAPRFDWFVLSFSELDYSFGDAFSHDNAAATSYLIDKTDPKINAMINDTTYHRYLDYMDQHFQLPITVDYICLTFAYVQVMAGNVAAAITWLDDFANSARGHDRERMDASADRLRSLLGHSLAEGQAMIQGIADHNRQALGLARAS